MQESLACWDGHHLHLFLGIDVKEFYKENGPDETFASTLIDPLDQFAA